MKAFESISVLALMLTIFIHKSVGIDVLELDGLDTHINSTFIEEKCACSSTFKYSDEVPPFTLPCSTASGTLPTDSGLRLPLVYAGNYALCNTFEQAHYCTIALGPLVLPLDIAHHPEANLYLGWLTYGVCVSQECGPYDVGSLFVKRAYALADSIKKSGSLDPYSRGYINWVESILPKQTYVVCTPKSEEAPRLSESKGSLVFVSVVGLLFGAVVVATGLEFYQQSKNDDDETEDGSKIAQSYIIIFSVISNVDRLNAKSPVNSFKILNLVRVLSIYWVIYGHTQLLASDLLGNPFGRQTLNPTTRNKYTQDISAVASTGGEFSVDTFFWMSGFLASFGTIKAFSSTSENGNSSLLLSPFKYFYILGMRFLRLTPSYAFVLFASYLWVPYMGHGPYWELSAGPSTNPGCSKYWWTNLLYINNLYDDKKNGMNGCLPHTWYLANDMQFFLLVPLFSWFFVQFRQRQNLSPWRRYMGLYGPWSCVILIQLIVTTILIQEIDGLTGTFGDHYNRYIYEKPWARVTPYAVGSLTAMWYFERENNNNQELNHGIKFVLSFFLGLGVMCGIVFMRYDAFVCREGHDCDIWGSLGKYGLFIAQNWKQTDFVFLFYMAYAYLFWSLSLSAVMVYFFTCRPPKFFIQIYESHFWVPLSRLTYGVYLVHMILLKVYFALGEAPGAETAVTNLYTSVAVAFFSFMISFALYLLVEKPFMNMFAMMMSSKKRNNDEANNNDENYRYSSLDHGEQDEIQTTSSVTSNSS